MQVQFCMTLVIKVLQDDFWSLTFDESYVNYIDMYNNR